MNHEKLYNKSVKQVLNNGYSENIKFFEKSWKERLPTEFVNNLLLNLKELSLSFDQWLKKHNYDNKIHGFDVVLEFPYLSFKKNTNKIFNKFLNINKINKHLNAYYLSESLELNNSSELNKIKNILYYQLYFGLKKHYNYINNDIEDILYKKNYEKVKDDFTYNDVKNINYSLIGVKNYLQNNIKGSYLLDYLDFYKDNKKKYCEVLELYNPLGDYNDDKRTQVLLDTLSFNRKSASGKIIKSIFVANLPNNSVLDREFLNYDIAYEQAQSLLFGKSDLNTQNLKYINNGKYNYWGYVEKPITKIQDFDNIKVSHNGIVNAVVIDIDREVELLTIAEDLDIPPNIIVIDKSDNNTIFKKSKCHLYYIFEEPVYTKHRNEKISFKVKAMLAGIKNALNNYFGGDICYTNVYAKNFVSNNKVSFSLNQTPYNFVNLYKKIDMLGLDCDIVKNDYKSNKNNKFKDLEQGEVISINRNNTLFRYGLHIGFKNLTLYKSDYNALEQELLRVNSVHCNPPLKDLEVKTISKSVYKYLGKGNLNSFYITENNGLITPIYKLKSYATMKEKYKDCLYKVYLYLKKLCKEQWSLIFPYYWRPNEYEVENAFLKIQNKINSRTKYGILSNRETLLKVIKELGISRPVMFRHLKALGDYYKDNFTVKIEEVKEYSDRNDYKKAVDELIKITETDFTYDKANISNDLKKDLHDLKFEIINKGNFFNIEKKLSIEKYNIKLDSIEDINIKNQVSSWINDDRIKLGYYFHKLYLLRNHIGLGNVKREEETLFASMIRAYCDLIDKLINNNMLLNITDKLKNMINKLKHSPLIQIKQNHSLDIFELLKS